MRIVLLLCTLVLVPTFGFSQSSSQLTDSVFHYSLRGTSGGVTAEVSLDKYVTSWRQHLTNSKDFQSKLDSTFFSENALKMLDNVVTMTVQNSGDKSIRPNFAVDSLVVSNGNVQFEMDLTKRYQEYPKNILKNSKTTFRVACPWEPMTAMNDDAVLPKALLMTQTVDALDKAVRDKARTFKSVDELDAWLKDRSDKWQGQIIFGEYAFGAEGMTISLNIVVYREIQ